MNASLTYRQSQMAYNCVGHFRGSFTGASGVGYCTSAVLVSWWPVTTAHDSTPKYRHIRGWTQPSHSSHHVVVGLIIATSHTRPTGWSEAQATSYGESSKLEPALYQTHGNTTPVSELDIINIVSRTSSVTILASRNLYSRLTRS